MKRLSVVCGLFMAIAGLAQDHPNEARGFDPTKIYDFHEIDTINSFNGNLVVRIPIGPVYHANALVKYQFTLVYNSHIWHYDDNGDGTFTVRPKKTNAGLGWNLSLGRLIANDDTGADTNSPFAVYEAPDGSQHAFYAALHCQDPGNPLDACYAVASTVGYTRDGSYLRMRSTGTAAQPEQRIDFPDGTTQVFQLLDPTIWARADCGANGSNCPNAVWRLVQITSVLANSVSIAYSSDAQHPEMWTVTDADRSGVAACTVSFKATGLSIQPLILDQVVLPATSGRTATYTFTNSGQTALPTPGGVSPPVQGTAGVPVFLLDSVTIPQDDNNSQATWSLMDGQVPAYENYGGDTSQAGPYWSGALHKLTLPAGGAISWDYTTISFDPPGGVGRSPALIRPIAVLTRTTYPSGSSTAEGTWQYGRQFGLVSCFVVNGNRPFKRQLTSWVMPPQTSGDSQYATVNYFSTYDGENDPCTVDAAEGWQTAEYGLPFTRYAFGTVSPDYASAKRYLSLEVVKDFSPPTTWDGHGSIGAATPAPTPASSTSLTYELDEETQNNPHDHNARVNSTATTYPLDSGCGGACFKASNLFNIDGFGRYRQASTTSNFPGDDQYRTEWTNYAATLDANGDWVLGTWDKHGITRDSSPRGPINDPSTVPFSLTTHASFARDTGLLTAKRTLNVSSTNSDTLYANDLLTTYSYDQRGYRLREQYAGGDTNALSTTSAAEFTVLTGPPYEIDYSPTYSFSGQLTARSGSYAGVGLSVLNETYDPGTGLVLTSTDPSGLTTTYSYDRRGRLIASATPGNADTTYSYTDSPASVTVKRISNGSVLAQQEYDYDGFGRLNYERKLMPNSATSVRQTVYTATGLRQQVSEFEATPAHFTVFSGFDAFDRATSVTAPDGHVTSVNWSGVRQRVEMKTIAAVSGGSETAQSRTEIYDSLGRLQQVTEPAGSSQITTYAYDVGGYLQTVLQTDGASTQMRTFNYDARAFLRSENHPESSTTNYSSYDSRGHAGARTLASGFADCTPQAYRCFDLQYTYDAGERLTHVTSRDPNNTARFRPLKDFTYGGPNDGLGQGKLKTSTRHNYQPGVNGPNLSDVVVTETYGYNDAAGRLTDKQTDIGLGTSINKTLKQSYIYDPLGLVSQITYPVCYPGTGQVGCAQGNWGGIQHVYTDGLLTEVSTPPNVLQPDFATSISYWPNGMVNTLSHANGVSDTYEIHDTAGTTNGMPRPAQIRFDGWVVGCESLSAAVSPTGAGSASISTPQNCTGGYTSGTTVSISAVANTGYVFVNWSAVNCSLANSYSPSTTCTASGASSGTVTANFAAVSRTKGDFDADGRSDVLWRESASGQNVLWLMSGVTLRSSASLNTVSDLNWKIAGIGDFNADGMADVLWFNASTGQVVIWLMNGSSILNAATVTTVSSTNWKVAGVVDANADGRSDVFWRNSVTGEMVLWFMNGTAISSTATLPTVSDLNWSVVGVGDVNGDRMADLFWRNSSTGDNVIWLMNGAAVSSSYTSPVPDLNYKVVTVADIDGDGKADVLWWNQSTGDVVLWKMDGTTVSSAGLITTVADVSWHPEGAGDFDGDARTDVIWRKVTTGDTVVWLLNGFSIKQSASVTQVSDTNWSIAGPR